MQKIKNKKNLFLVMLLFSSLGMFHFCLEKAYASKIPQEYIKKIELKDRIYKTELNTAKHPNFFDIYTKYYYKDQEIKFASGSLIYGYVAFNHEIESREVWGISRGAIADYISKELVPKYNREMQPVRIFRNPENGKIEFEGYAVNGRQININKLTNLIVDSLKNEVDTIVLPFDYEPSVLKVEDKELSEKGIEELIATGESNFTGSSWNRKTNIRVGMESFNGFLLEKGEIFSIGEELGSITAAKGYKSEMVIKHDGTKPELGGGLCQVSTTAFRAALQAGFEIVERWNHSYAVTYYEPYGTDATIYFPLKDFKFKNNTDGAILIQTYIDEEKSLAYVNYFGTRDERKVNILGPYVSHWKYPSTKKFEPDPNKRNAQKHILNTAYNGLSVYWQRDVSDPNNLEVKSSTGTTPLFMTGASLPNYDLSSIYRPASLFPTDEERKKRELREQEKLEAANSE